MGRPLTARSRRPALTRGAVVGFAAGLVLNPVFKVVTGRRGIGAATALAERLGGSSPLGAGSRYDVHRARRIAGGVHLAARVPPVDVVCLPRSLTLWCLLRRRGIPASLLIGVGDATGAFGAHAWVRVHDADVGEDPAQIAQYAAFADPVLGAPDPVLGAPDRGR